LSMVIYLVKIHGNWCGPSWTGGQKVDAQDYKGSWSYPAIDQLDRACRTHDKECASRGDKGCCAKDDEKLITVASKITQNPINILFKPTLVVKALAVANGMNIARLTRRC
jgi:hypothetical protein